MAGRWLLCGVLAALRTAGALRAGASGHLVPEGERILPNATLSTSLFSHGIQATLIVCNAYPYSKPLHVFHMRSQQRLTGKQPLSYQECGDFLVWFNDGDQLDFRTYSNLAEEEELRVGGNSLGIFRAWGLPKATSALMLVPHRKGTSASMAFESHAFRELPSTQLALVDTYHGRLVGRVRIVDMGEAIDPKDQTSGFDMVREEELSFNSVITLRQGNYQVVLSNARGRDVSVVDLQVEKQRQKFVILRTGSDEDLQFKVGNKTALPQELLLHKMATSEEEKEKSSGFAPAPWPLAAAAAAALAALEMLHT